MKNKPTRRMRVQPGLIEVKLSWSDSALTIIDWDKDQRKEVVVTIRDPWQLSYIRRELDKIANYWREKAAAV